MKNGKVKTTSNSGASISSLSVISNIYHMSQLMSLFGSYAY